MSALNWKEIQLILQENDVTGSKIQSVTQNTFNSLTWELYQYGKGRFYYYTEVGTQTARIHPLNLSKPTSKTAKLQRFIQFTRKNIEGSIITKVEQLPFDRCVVWHLNNHDKLMKIYIRLYSGSGANIIVTDNNNVILDLLLRRPNREETSGKILKTETRTEENKTYEVRPYSGSFSAYIEKLFSEEQTKDIYEILLNKVLACKEQELSRIHQSIKSTETTIENNKNYDNLRYIADLLSSHSHLIKSHESFVTITDWQTNSPITIMLNKALSAGENVQFYYDKYQKSKGTYDNAVQELEKLHSELKYTEEKFNSALLPTDNHENDIKKLKNLLNKTQSVPQKQVTVGLRAISGNFELLIGRNAKENDELLRHYAKGNDMWMHTRNFPGGYVFIKYKKNKTIPLEVLLDAANLAVLFSKGKNDSTVELYYTQVHYLRRAKNGKTGLVIPTQEKNLTIKPDKARISKFLPN